MPTHRQLPVLQPLLDRQERRIRYLRVSLTDRCNYRCTYCMPEQGVELVPRRELLSIEEIIRLVGVFARFGVERVRLTGGEPTIRRGFLEVVRGCAATDGIAEVAMTSNAHRLPELAGPLAAAGLRSVNVSLDTLDRDSFREVTRRGDVDRVVAGIDAALAAGIEVKINVVAMRGLNHSELADLTDFAWNRGITARFIEHMPMSGGSLYRNADHLSAAEIRRELERHYGAPCLPESPPDAPRGPARYWIVAGRRFGIISAMSEHFCGTCNRVRLSAAGALHTCLADDGAADLRQLIRQGDSDDQLAEAIRLAVAAKRDGHEFLLSGEGGPRKHMVSIGG